MTAKFNIVLGNYGTKAAAEVDATQFLHPNVFQYRDAVFPNPASHRVSANILSAKEQRLDVPPNPLYPWAVALVIELTGEPDDVAHWTRDLMGRARGLMQIQSSAVKAAPAEEPEQVAPAEEPEKVVPPSEPEKVVPAEVGDTVEHVLAELLKRAPAWNQLIPPHPVDIVEIASTAPGMLEGTAPRWNPEWLTGLLQFILSVVREELSRVERNRNVTDGP